MYYETQGEQETPQNQSKDSTLTCLGPKAIYL